MSDFGIIHSSYWTRGSGKRLRGKQSAQLVGLYLLTCPSANEIGLYYLPLATLCHELAMSPDEARTALKACADANLALYDEDAELAWVPNAAERRFGTVLKPGDKRRTWFAKEIGGLGDHRFVGEFIARYGEAYGLTSKGPSKGPSMGLPEATEAPSETSNQWAMGQSTPSPSPISDPDPEPESTRQVEIPAREAPSVLQVLAASRQSSPPADIPITPEVEAACAMAGAPMPTRAHVQACLANARQKGHTSYDWGSTLVTWMHRERQFGRDRIGKPFETGPSEKRAGTMSARMTRAEEDAYIASFEAPMAVAK